MAATMEDALRRLRQRQFGQEPMPWMNEAREEAVEHSNDQESEAAEEAEADQLSAGYSNLNWEGAPEVAESPADETTSDVERGEPENAAEPLAVSSAASMSMATMSRDESMDEALRQLRLRRFSQEAAPWIGEAREEASEHLVAAANEAANEGAAAAVEAVAAEATTEETYVYTPPDAARSATAEPVASALPYSYPESEQPVASERWPTERSNKQVARWSGWPILPSDSFARYSARWRQPRRIRPEASWSNWRKTPRTRRGTLWRGSRWKRHRTFGRNWSS
jgi:hypothetical protein